MTDELREALENVDGCSTDHYCGCYHRANIIAKAYRAVVAERDALAMEKAHGYEYVRECGHNSYWLGAYGTCMACRAEAAESKNAELTKRVEELEKENIGFLKVVDELRGALSELRIRLLEVYGGPSPLLDAAWEQSRKALAKEIYEHE